MDDAVCMGILQRIGRLNQKAGNPARVLRPCLQPLLKRLPLDELGNQKTDTLVGLADLVQRHDGWMLELRHAAGFPLKTAGFFLISQIAGALDLERDGAVQFGVASTEDMAK